MAPANDPREARVDLLGRYDIVYLSGGDPVAFRRHLRQWGLDAALCWFAATGRLIVAASGGAMQLTPNISLFRLLSSDVDAVVSGRDQFDGIGLARCELLPHMNRHDAAFLEKVRQYSARVPHEIVALADGAVAFCADDGECRCSGESARYHHGVRSPAETTL